MIEQTYSTKPRPGARVDLLHPANRGVVGWWMFNEGSGLTVNDTSPFKNSGTLNNVNPVSAWPGSSEGRAVGLAGGDDHINSIVLPSLTNLTIAVIATPISLPSESVIASHKYLSDTFIDLRLTSLRRLRMQYNLTSKTVGVGDEVTLGKSVFLVGTAKASGIRLYIDGLFKALQSSITLQATDRNWRFGQRGTDGTFPFDGKLSYVKIYNRAISDREVHALKNFPYAGILA